MTTEELFTAMKKHKVYHVETHPDGTVKLALMHGLAFVPEPLPPKPAPVTPEEFESEEEERKLDSRMAIEEALGYTGGRH